MLEEMDVFATVVEQSSLNKASQVLNLSQPALSRKIAKLEQNLGVELFKRNGKRLELTRIGQISYEFALKMRQQHREYLQAIADDQIAGKSSITIGASLTTLQSTLPEMISMYTRSHPEADIKAVTGKTHEIVTLVKENKVDIGLVASQINQPGLNCVPLFDDHLCLVMPKHQFILSKTSDNIDVLNGLPMIVFSKGTWYRILTDELFHSYAIMPDIKMEIDSFEAIIRLVSPCKAATLLPRSYLRPNLLEDNELVVMSIHELEQTKRTTSLVFGDETMLSLATRHLIEEAKAYFKRPAVT